MCMSGSCPLATMVQRLLALRAGARGCMQCARLQAVAAMAAGLGDMCLGEAGLRCIFRLDETHSRSSMYPRCTSVYFRTSECSCWAPHHVDHRAIARWPSAAPTGARQQLLQTGSPPRPQPAAGGGVRRARGACAAAYSAVGAADSPQRSSLSNPAPPTSPAGPPEHGQGLRRAGLARGEPWGTCCPSRRSPAPRRPPPTTQRRRQSRCRQLQQTRLQPLSAAASRWGALNDA